MINSEYSCCWCCRLLMLFVLYFLLFRFAIISSCCVDFHLHIRVKQQQPKKKQVNKFLLSTLLLCVFARIEFGWIRFIVFRRVFFRFYLCSSTYCYHFRYVQRTQCRRTHRQQNKIMLQNTIERYKLQTEW